MFHSLRIAAMIDETPDAKSIVLEIPGVLAPAFAYRSGQFLTLRLDVGGGPVERCYSLSSAPKVEEIHKVTIKRVPGGVLSPWLHEHVSVGDYIEVKPPEGRFVIDEADAPLLMFAGGSGITPVISIIKSALTSTARRVRLVYANRTRASIIFYEELERLVHGYPNRLEVAHRIDDTHGSLDASAIASAVVDLHDPSVFVCGPPPFMSLVQRAVIAAGTPPDRVRIERFTLSAASTTTQSIPAMAAPSGLRTPEFIDVELRGEHHRLPYVKGETLLQTARDGGLDPPYLCEEGFCGSCASDLLEGQVEMATCDALTETEQEKGMILACQSRPLTNRCSFRFIDN